MTGSIVTLNDTNLESGRTSGLITTLDDINVQNFGGIYHGPGALSDMAPLRNRASVPGTIVVGKASGLSTYGYANGSWGNGPFGSMSFPVFNGFLISSVTGGGSNLNLVFDGGPNRDVYRCVQFKLSANSAPFAWYDTTTASFFEVGLGPAYSYWSWSAPTGGAINWPSLNGATIYYNLFGPA